MNKLQLLSRQDCHLCDEAADLIQAASISDQVEVVDIDIHLDLIRAYGDRVPVLRTTSGDHELAWPFGQPELFNWLVSIK